MGFECSIVYCVLFRLEFPEGVTHRISSQLLGGGWSGRRGRGSRKRGCDLVLMIDLSLHTQDGPLAPRGLFLSFITHPRFSRISNSFLSFFLLRHKSTRACFCLVRRHSVFRRATHLPVMCPTPLLCHPSLSSHAPTVAVCAGGAGGLYMPRAGAGLLADGHPTLLGGPRGGG